MHTITTAVVGLGYWGPNLVRNFAAQQGCTVKYACDLEEANLEKLRRKFPAVTYTQTYQDVLADEEVELVVIATPTTTHFPLAKLALESGKHVFVEKPMCASSEEGRTLIALAEQQDKHIFVDHPFMFAPAVEKISSYLSDGTLGDLLYFDSQRHNLGLIQKDTNVFWDLAVHDLSILSTLVDLSQVTEVRAHGHAYFGEQIEHGHMHLTFANGVGAHISVSWLSPVKVRDTIVCGTKAMATYDDTEPSEKVRLYDKGVEHDDTKPDPFFPKYRSGDVIIPAMPIVETLSIEAHHVLECIRGNETPRVSGKDGLYIVDVLEKVNASLGVDQ